MYITQTKQSDVICFAAGGCCVVLVDKDFVHLDLPPGDENKEVLKRHGFSKTEKTRPTCDMDTLMMFI